MTELLKIDGVELCSAGIKIPNSMLYAGDIVWVETENPLFCDVFIGILFGLVEKKRGKIKFFRSRTSYFDIASWTPYVQDAVSLCSLYSYSKGVKISTSINELKKILNEVNASYVLNMNLREMTKPTKTLLSWAITLSVPDLNIVLNDPYYGADEKTSSVLSSRLDDQAKDGSLILIVSTDKPRMFSEHLKFLRGCK